MERGREGWKEEGGCREEVGNEVGKEEGGVEVGKEGGTAKSVME